MVSIADFKVLFPNRCFQTMEMWQVFAHMKDMLEADIVNW